MIDISVIADLWFICKEISAAVNDLKKLVKSNKH